jgi:hypothetical protein
VPVVLRAMVDDCLHREGKWSGGWIVPFFFYDRDTDAVANPVISEMHFVAARNTSRHPLCTARSF